MATRKAKDMLITLQAIKCTNTGSDPGANLEIFGHLKARGMTIDADGNFHVGFEHTLWAEKSGRTSLEVRSFPSINP